MRPQGDDDGISTVAFSPDGLEMASGTVSGKIRLWNLQTARPLSVQTVNDDSIDSLGFSPDGKTLVSGSAQSLVQTMMLRGQVKVQ